MSFSLFALNKTIINAIFKANFQTPTAIQKEVIPLIMAKKDVLAQAQTGSGKTAAFVLPILNALLLEEQVQKKQKIKVLVLTPTRELTLQVAKVLESLSQDFTIKPKVVSVIGGQSISNQLLDVQKGCDIVVATSGRLLDIINKKQIDLSSLSFFVLDEADKMLDANFAVELEAILAILPKQRQNLLFSATIGFKIDDIALKITNSAIKVHIKSDEIVVKTLQQRVFLVNKPDKSALLRKLIALLSLKHILVFMANKRSCDNIASKFRKYGFNANSFHADLTQEERVLTLEKFKNRKTDILFATDIAARGLDIETINCVVNFDLPRSAANYIHRVGRTARAGKSGLAITLLSAKELEHFKLIEKRYKIDVLKEQIEGFAFTQDIEPKVKGKSPIKSKRKSKKDRLREKELKNSL